MGFQISALNLDQFAHLFGMDDKALAKQGVERMVVDSNPGYPCRVSLQDAEVGETVLLMNYEHQPMPTPYRSRHAIFIRERADQTTPAAGEVPSMFRHRLLSVIDADVIDGENLESLIDRMFANDAAEYLHIHNARLGCYAASVNRA
jgi:hypothetical protein